MAEKIFEISGYAKTGLIFGDLDLGTDEDFKTRISETQLEKIKSLIEIENIKELNKEGEKPSKSSKKK